jgi:hypothetical protein
VKGERGEDGHLHGRNDLQNRLKDVESGGLFVRFFDC